MQAVDSARGAAPIDRAALAQTSLALALDALLWRQADHWYAALPLRANRGGANGGDIDIGRVRAALADEPAGTAMALNMKQETDSLYGSYLHEAARLSLTGFGAILVLLSVALRAIGARSARDRAAGAGRARGGCGPDRQRRGADDPAPDRPAADRRRRIQLRPVL